MTKFKQWVNDNLLKKEYKTYNVHVRTKTHNKHQEFIIQEKAKTRQEAVASTKAFISKFANPGDNYKVIKAKRVD